MTSHIENDNWNDFVKNVICVKLRIFILNLFSVFTDACKDVICMRGMKRR